MATKDPAGPTAATLQELKAVCADSDFIVNCLEQSMTLEDAKTTLITNLNQKVSDLESIVADFKTKPQAALSPEQARQGTSIKHDSDQPGPPADGGDSAPLTQSAPPQAPPADPPKDQTPAAIGNEPLTTSQIGDPSTAAAFGADPMAFFNKAKAEVKAELSKDGKKPQPMHIVRAVYEKYPGLYEAVESIRS